MIYLPLKELYMTRNETLNIYSPDMLSDGGQPMAESSVVAGFPSPAEGLINLKLDLNRELVKNPSSTFYARVSGYSMRDEGINDGDLLVIDKSVEPRDGCLAVAYIDGEFTLKRFADHGDYGLLVPANEAFEPIRVCADNDFMIWGVVRYVIKKM